ncbi:MAG: phosphoribosylformylglycinamidine cyclo-ligase [Pseudomonadales bacterium]|nr:phosphoribosylformylglycinamidine cyclo-ligase [Pseudomonadales bacterium]
MNHSTDKPLSYKESGVDIDAGAELVRRIKPAIKKTQRPEILSGLGGFAAIAGLPTKYREPVLVTGTDGVGTKLKLAITHDFHDHVGQDLVAMCVNDVLVTGAEPFLFLDYYATSTLDIETASRVITGIAKGCEMAGCALVGGETAEMPGFYAKNDYDLAGFCVGVAERSRVIDGQAMCAGQTLIGIKSSGPHSNGYSLIRKVLDRQAGPPDAALLDQLMQPTRIYVRAILNLLDTVSVTAMSHITGGGLLENLPRMFSDKSLAALIDLNSWEVPEIFNWLQQAGNISTEEMFKTFNCGIGFVICIPEQDTRKTLDLLQHEGEQAIVLGVVIKADGAEPGQSQLLLNGDASFQFT